MKVRFSKMNIPFYVLIVSNVAASLFAVQSISLFEFYQSFSECSYISSQANVNPSQRSLAFSSNNAW
jgi:hypothetical protein